MTAILEGEVTTLKEALADLGLTHKRRGGSYEHDIFDATTGELVAANLDAYDAWEWLEYGYHKYQHTRKRRYVRQI